MNLFSGSRHKDFFVWVDPKDYLIQHQVTVVGSFSSVPSALTAEELMFIPNPKFGGEISPFQNNLLRNYIVEYNLEMARRSFYMSYPSRLEAVFLLPSEEEALKYREHNPYQTGNRILKKVKAAGEYLYSLHDSSWVDYLRIGHAMDPEALSAILRAYWEGQTAESFPLASMGKAWSKPPVTEVLFYGKVEFYDRSLEVFQGGNPM